MNILTFLGGIVSIIVGILLLIYNIRNLIPQENDITKDNLQGYIGSLGFIILGIILILNELKKIFN